MVWLICEFLDVYYSIKVTIIRLPVRLRLKVQLICELGLDTRAFTVIVLCGTSLIVVSIMWHHVLYYQDIGVSCCRWYYAN